MARYTLFNCFTQVLILFIACFSLFHSSEGETLSAIELRYRVLFYKSETPFHSRTFMFFSKWTWLRSNNCGKFKECDWLKRSSYDYPNARMSILRVLSELLFFVICIMKGSKSQVRKRVTIS